MPTVYRVDPTPVMTTSGKAPAGGEPALFAVAGATIALYSDEACTVPATAYTDASGNTACPTYAPVTLPGSNVPTSTAGPQGQFGFWLPSGTYFYTLTLPSGIVFSALPVTAGGGPATNAPALPFLVSSDYNFAPIAPGGNLVAGANVITFPVVPQGVNGTDQNHYLLISGGNGTPEVCPVIGGSGQAGDHKGIILIQCANPHSGGWTVSSATGGIQEAIQAAPDVGAVVEIPSGTTVLYGPVTTRTGTYIVRGQGEDVSLVRVAATQNGDLCSFPLTAKGVFVTWLASLPGPYVPYGPPNGGSLGMSVTDLSISFYQPDSLVIANYIHWPPAIYGEYTERAHFDRLKICAAWDGIKISKGNGFYSRDVKISNFHRALEVDGIVDSTRIDSFHQWVFGLTYNQNIVMLNDPNVYGFWIGRADDLKITNGLTVCAQGMDIHQGADGTTPWVSLINTDFDNGGVTFSSTTGGRAIFVNCQFNPSSYNANGIVNTARSGFQFKSTASGEVQFTSCWFAYGDAGITSPSVDIDYSAMGASDSFNNGVSFLNCRFYDPLQNLDTIYVHSSTTGTAPLVLTGNHFAAPVAQGGAFAQSIVHAAGPVRVIATGNTISEKKSGTGSWFTADTDSGHVVLGNSAIGWGMTYPATQIASIFGNNLGVVNTPIGTATQANAGTLTPTGCVFHVTTVDAFSTITVVKNLGGINYSGFLPEFTIIPDAAFTWITGANIAVAGAAVVGKALTFTFDSAIGMYYPSYTA